MDYTGHFLPPHSLPPGPNTGVSSGYFPVAFKHISLYLNNTHTHTHTHTRSGLLASSRLSWGRSSAAVDWMLRPLLPSRSSGSGAKTVCLGVLGARREREKGRNSALVMWWRETGVRLHLVVGEGG